MADVRGGAGHLDPVADGLARQAEAVREVESAVIDPGKDVAV
jgi:hypothetical protein